MEQYPNQIKGEQDFRQYDSITLFQKIVWYNTEYKIRCLRISFLAK